MVIDKENIEIQYKMQTMIFYWITYLFNAIIALTCSIQTSGTATEHKPNPKLDNERSDTSRILQFNFDLIFVLHCNRIARTYTHLQIHAFTHTHTHAHAQYRVDHAANVLLFRFER